MWLAAGDGGGGAAAAEPAPRTLPPSSPAASGEGPSGQRGGAPTPSSLSPGAPAGPALTFRVRRGDKGEVPVGGRIGRGRARRLHPAGLGALGGAGARLGPGPRGRSATLELPGGLLAGRHGLGRGRRQASQATRRLLLHQSPAGGERPSTTTPAP